MLAAVACMSFDHLQAVG